MAWTERAGPPVKAPEGPGDYGSKLLDRAITHQLDGSVHREWDKAGVVASLATDKAFYGQMRSVKSPWHDGSRFGVRSA